MASFGHKHASGNDINEGTGKKRRRGCTRFYWTIVYCGKKSNGNKSPMSLEHHKPSGSLVTNGRTVSCRVKDPRFVPESHELDWSKTSCRSEREE
eukprot:scaffold11978_cov153-Amphora_coffeaeformis.AAC.2